MIRLIGDVFKEHSGSLDLSYARRNQAEMSAPFVLIAERYERKGIAVTANSSIYQRENSVGVATLASLRRPDNGSRFEAFGLISN